jgi:hypothetical protein
MKKENKKKRRQVWKDHIKKLKMKRSKINRLIKKQKNNYVKNLTIKMDIILLKIVKINKMIKKKMIFIKILLKLKLINNKFHKKMFLN